MRTVTIREPAPQPTGEPPSLARRGVAALAGPLLITGSVLFAMRGFAFHDLLTNQHPDILSFWLPHFCFLGNSLSAGHIPLWNPFQMAGMPYAADPQSGWLNAPAMLLFSSLSCGTALRFFIVLQPLLAGLGLYWFLRRERLVRVAATAGGLAFALAISASTVAVSLPFSGSLAWTPFALVGASGYLSATRLPARLGWVALAAVAWGQVAASHMSHGLAMATLVVGVYVIVRSVLNVRMGRETAGRAALLALGFAAFLPLANLALFVPRIELLPRTSLRGGYGAVGGAVARIAGIADRPLAPGGVWSGWPLALGSAPGAYVGATILLSLPLALRTRGRRYLALAFGVLGLAAWLLTLNLFVGSGWFRAVALHLPFGDVYLHNPGRLRYLMLLVAPVLGALGIHGLVERPIPPRRLLAWLAAGAALFLAVPLILGAHPARFVLLAAGGAIAIPALLWLGARRRLAGTLVVGVLAAELLAGVAWSQSYRGGTVLLGLEPHQTNLIPGPLKWPDVPVDDYLRPGRVALAMEGEPGRYLSWLPPVSYYPKGYLSYQAPEAWPALVDGRGMLFGLSDALGYGPIQLTRYWSYVRATNERPIFYNASVIQAPSETDVRLLGIRYLVTPRVLPSPVPAREVAIEGRYRLSEVRGWQPRVSVVPSWNVRTSGAGALLHILQPGFDPALQAAVQGDPGIVPQPGARPGRASYAVISPEDLHIDVIAPSPSLVVVRNAFDPGWTATVDGRPAPVLAADYFLQAVPVPTGHHDVRLEYHDPAVGVGLAASAAVWASAATGAALAGVVLRRRRSPGHSAAAGVEGDGEGSSAQQAVSGDPARPVKTTPARPPTPPPDGVDTPR